MTSIPGQDVGDGGGATLFPFFPVLEEEFGPRLVCGEGQGGGLKGIASVPITPFTNGDKHVMYIVTHRFIQA